MRIKFWGVRGSLPAPLNDDALKAKLFEAVAGAQGVDLDDPDAVRAYLAGLPFYIGGVVGGNTTCVEIRSGAHTLVVDAGSGIRPLGLSMLRREFGRGQGTLHLFFTHAHWDHLMGFPFFKPAYVPGNRIICYAVDHHPLEYLRHLMTGPTFFPIDPDQLPASLEFVTLREGDAVEIGPVRVTNIRLHHPGIAYAYRFEEGSRSFVFASDAEFKLLDDEYIKDHVAFFRGADALAYDAQFSLKDAFAYEDWGHSSAMIGVDLAIRAGARRLITVHHDPNDTDRQIWEVAEAAQDYARLSPGGAELEVTVGYEGLELYLSGDDDLQVFETLEHGALVLSLAGRLGRQAAEELTHRLDRFETGDWRRPVAVDLSEGQPVEAEVVAALCAALQTAPDIPLALVVPSHRLRRDMARALAGYGHRIAIYADRASAIAAIVGPVHLRLQGSRLADRYRLTSVVATDDRAALYEAFDEQMNRPALAHVLNPGLTHAARLRTLSAFRDWSRLTHPALIQVLDILPDEGGLTVILLEAPPGQTLKDVGRNGGHGGRAAAATAIGVGRRLLEVLVYLHAQGIAHGELRPEVIFWDGWLKLPLSGVTPLHLRGLNAYWMGPGAYRAPEQSAGESPTPRGDLYSLGIILYQMLSGVHPFEAESAEVSSLLQASQAATPDLHSFNPAVSPALEAVVLRLMARDPDDRFGSAREALEALANVGDG